MPKESADIRVLSIIATSGQLTRTWPCCQGSWYPFSEICDDCRILLNEAESMTPELRGEEMIFICININISVISYWICIWQLYGLHVVTISHAVQNIVMYTCMVDWTTQNIYNLITIEKTLTLKRMSMWMKPVCAGPTCQNAMQEHIYQGINLLFLSWHFNLIHHIVSDKLLFRSQKAK